MFSSPDCRWPVRVRVAAAANVVFALVAAVASPQAAGAQGQPTQAGAPAGKWHRLLLNGQGRWGFSPWDKPDVYMFESAQTHVREVTAPFLIMHGTADPTVAFQNSLGFYNALRYNEKNAVLLAYTGEVMVSEELPTGAI